MEDTVVERYLKGTVYTVEQAVDEEGFEYDAWWLLANNNLVAEFEDRELAELVADALNSKAATLRD